MKSLSMASMLGTLNCVRSVAELRRDSESFLLLEHTVSMVQ